MPGAGTASLGFRDQAAETGTWGRMQLISMEVVVSVTSSPEDGGR